MECWILPPQYPLVVLDLVRLCYAIHLRHLNVGENYMVAYITARFRHVVVVHVYCDEPVRSFITFLTELNFDDRLKRHQIKQNVVNE